MAAEHGPRFLTCYFLLFFRLIELSFFSGGLNILSPSMSPILRERKSPESPRAPEHLLSPCPISSTPEPPEHLRALLELLSPPEHLLLRLYSVNAQASAPESLLRAFGLPSLSSYLRTQKSPENHSSGLNACYNSRELIVLSFSSYNRAFF